MAYAVGRGSSVQLKCPLAWNCHQITSHTGEFEWHESSLLTHLPLCRGHHFGLMAPSLGLAMTGTLFDTIWTLTWKPNFLECSSLASCRHHLIPVSALQKIQSYFTEL